MANLETEFKRLLRSSWKARGWWSEAYEPGHGSGVGYPDVQLLVDHRIVPVELKIGEFRDGLLFSEDIRPAQIKWHWELSRAGGLSVTLVGVQVGDDFEMYSIVPAAMKHWRKGFNGMDWLHVGQASNVGPLWAHLFGLLINANAL